MELKTPYDPLHPSEAELLDYIENSSGRYIQSGIVASSGKSDVTVRAAFLTWLLIKLTSTKPPIVELNLTGAIIEGILDLSGLTISVSPHFLNCQFPDGILLKDAEVPGFYVHGGVVQGIDADRAKVKGSLGLTAVEVRRQLRLCGAKIGGNLNLRRSKIFGEDATESKLIALFADGLEVTGNVLMSDHFSSAGEVKLNGCKIGRDLNLAGASLRARDSSSLSLNGTQVAGSVYLNQAPWATNPDGTRFCSIGTIQLAGARIDGELNCEGGLFIAASFARPPISTTADHADSDMTIKGSNLLVGGAVRLCDGFYSRGFMHFVSASIGSDLLCDGCFFDYPCGDAIELDGATVGGGLYFGSGRKSRYKGGKLVGSFEIISQTNGFFSLSNMQIKQGLYVRGLIFRPVPFRKPATELERKGNCGIVASFAQIAGGVELKIGLPSREPRGSGSGVEIDFEQATIDVLTDSKESWGHVSAPNLVGLTYRGITSLQSNEMWRCDLLDRQHGASSEIREPPGRRFLPFHPQPYLELAKAMASVGYLPTATKILIRLERAQTRFSKFGFWWRRGRELQSIATSYGYRPFRAIYALLIWTLVTGYVFSTSPCGQIVDTTPDKSIGSVIGSAVYCDKAGSDFSPYIYALDTLTPIVDLHQKSRWLVQVPSARPWGRAFDSLTQGLNTALVQFWDAVRVSLAPMCALMNPYIGWVLGSLFVAGVAGLLRKGSSS
jgi:hypothetical protein